MKTRLDYLVFFLYTAIMITMFIEAISKNNWLYAGMGTLLLERWLDWMTN